MNLRSGGTPTFSDRNFAQVAIIDSQNPNACDFLLTALTSQTKLLVRFADFWGATMYLRIALAWWVLIFASPCIAADAKFVGDLVAKLASDGRNMVLMQPFGFVDTQGRQWDVPPGTETDGASIPQAFWVAYPPFTGLYRSAAVIHDYYCQTQERSWQDTHNVFYDAMITAGVDQKTAKVMWSAVYYMGPRWVLGGSGLASNGPGPSELGEQQKAIDKLDVWISTKNPSQAEIAEALNRGVIP